MMNSLQAIFGYKIDKFPQSVHKDDKKKDSTSSTLQGTLLSTLLFIVLNLALKVKSASYLRTSRLHVFFVWLQSLLALVFLWISKRRRRWSFIQQARHPKALPVLCCYVIYVAINESYSNGYKNSSGGPEVLQLGLASSPLFMILAMTWFQKKTNASLVTVFVVFVSVIMIIIFCSENDPYIPYKVTFSYGIFGLIHGFMLALFVLSSKMYLSVEEISISQLVHSINLACVLFLPFVMIINGEVDIMIAKGMSSHGGLYNVLFMAFILALLRIFDQIVSFYHIKNLSSLLHIAARGFTFLPATIFVTFLLKMELLISSFLSFWLIGAIFLAVLVEELTDINS